MAAYIIVNVDIKDRTAFQEYVQNVPPIVRRFGGEYLAVSDNPKVLEGNWKAHRLVIVRFPGMEAAEAFLNDADYLPWKQLRQRVTDSEMVVLEGLR